MKRSLTDGWFLPAIVILAAGLLVYPGTAAGQGSVESTDASSAVEAATFLLVPLGARNVGLGGAVAGAYGDLEGAVWNPAGLVGVERWGISYLGANDFGTTTHALGGVVRWADFRVGLSILAVDLGSFEGRDAANQPLGTIDVANTLAILSVAHPISPVFDVGGSYKFLRTGGSCSGCTGLEPGATGHAFDLAVSARPPGMDRFRLGLVVSNLGPSMSFRDDSPGDPLPARIRIGGEVDVLPPSADRPVELRARADVRQTFAEFDDFDVFAGVELAYAQVVFLRGGYAAAGAGRSGAALGIGLRYQGFGLDLGRSFDDFAGFDSDAPFQVAVSYQP